MNYNAQRWFTLIACMLASMCAGLAYSWSVFLKPLIEMYNWSAAEASLTFTLLMSTAGITAIFAGKAQDYIQPRFVMLLGGALFGLGLACIGFIHTLLQLYLCVIFAGIGLGWVYPGGTVTNSIRFFPEKKGMASGMIAAGYGIGPVIWAPLSVKLINQFGIITTMKVLGLFFFLVIGLLSLLVKTAPVNYQAIELNSNSNITQTSSTEKNWRQMLRDPLFYFLAITFTLGEISGMMIIGHASPIAQEMMMMTPAAAAGIVSLLAIANTTGKIGWGMISDRIGRYPVVILLLIFGGLAMVGLALFKSYFLFTTFIIIIGLCYGGFLSVMAPITADLFGSRNLPVNYGVMFLSVAIAAYVGPYLAAVVKEAENGIYTHAFVIAALLNLVGIVVFGIFMFMRQGKISISITSTNLNKNTSYANRKAI